MARPHVTLKLATSLDGRIATPSGESRWITGPMARAEVQRMRAASDAVLVGIGTARADDPLLTARTEPPPARPPIRVVLDRKLSLSPTSILARTAKEAPVVVLSTRDWPNPPQALVNLGVEIMLARPAPGEGEIAAALRALELGHEVAHVLVEGGGVVAAAFLREGLVDRIEWLRAPIVLGGDGRPAVAALALTTLSDAPAFRRVALRELGPDIWESYERV